MSVPVWDRWRRRQTARLAILETPGRAVRCPVELLPPASLLRELGLYARRLEAPFIVGQPRPLLLAWLWR